jgi:hypothetical protein
MTRRSEFLYTPLSEALERLNSQSDANRVSSLPPCIAPAQYAVFARQVATPSHEVARFLSMTVTYNLRPLFFEFHDDKFVTRNRCKFALARMRFADTINTNNDGALTDVLDIQACQGRSFASISTKWGEPFVKFHHRLFREVFPIIPDSAFFDGSGWLHSHGLSPRKYYPAFLSLFVSGCVLFESYLLGPDELDFTENIVMPAFDSVSKAFGRRPLIVRLDPPDSEGNSFWLSYPTSLFSVVAGAISTPPTAVCARAATASGAPSL